jgi:hypothetical protein
MDVEDDRAYKRSVRNMSIVLAAIVITIFAALGYSYLNPVHYNFQKSVSLQTGQSFTLYLNISSTAIPSDGSVNITAWVISTYPSIHNITAANSWAVDSGGLWTRICTSGFPIGVGVMQGHYDSTNVTSGTLLTLIRPAVLCPVQLMTPQWFAFESQSSSALVSVNNNIGTWDIRSAIIFSGTSVVSQGAQLTPGVYTVVAADEWGDVLTTNFIVS